MNSGVIPTTAAALHWRKDYIKVHANIQTERAVNIYTVSLDHPTDLFV